MTAMQGFGSSARLALSTRPTEQRSESQASELRKRTREFTPQLMQSSVSSVKQSSVGKDSEEIIEGCLAVQDVEKFGFKVKLPEMLRRLKAKLGRP